MVPGRPCKYQALITWRTTVSFSVAFLIFPVLTHSSLLMETLKFSQGCPEPQSSQPRSIQGPFLGNPSLFSGLAIVVKTCRTMTKQIWGLGSCPRRLVSEERRVQRLQCDHLCTSIVHSFLWGQNSGCVRGVEQFLGSNWGTIPFPSNPQQTAPTCVQMAWEIDHDW